MEGGTKTLTPSPKITLFGGTFSCGWAPSSSKIEPALPLVKRFEDSRHRGERRDESTVKQMLEESKRRRGQVEELLTDSENGESSDEEDEEEGDAEGDEKMKTPTGTSLRAPDNRNDIDEGIDVIRKTKRP